MTSNCHTPKFGVQIVTSVSKSQKKFFFPNCHTFFIFLFYYSPNGLDYNGLVNVPKLSHFFQFEVMEVHTVVFVF